MVASISVIIPNYNHSQYLSARINSVLNQTVQPLEIIILDDCSTDNSHKIIDQYKSHPRISTTVYNEINSGSTFRQWQKGVELAKGELVWIAESDDLAAPNFIESLVPFFISHPDTVIAFSGTTNITSDGTPIGRNRWASDLDNRRWDYDYINDGYAEIKDFFIYRNIIPNASAAIFKRTAFQKVDPDVYSDYKYAGDWLLWVNLLRHGSIAYSSQPLNYFRHHAATTRATKTLDGEVRRLRECLEVVRQIDKVFEIKPTKARFSWIITIWFESRKSINKNLFYYLFPPISFHQKLLFYQIAVAKCKQGC